MKIHKFLQYVNEDLTSELSNQLDDKNKDIKIEILKMIQKSINSEDKEVLTKFIESYSENPNESEIEGLINGSDVQDFYKKFSGEIDEILSDINFYDDEPSGMDCFSLYDYVVKGTMKAVENLIGDIKKELMGQDSQTGTENTEQV